MLAVLSLLAYVGLALGASSGLSRNRFDGYQVISLHPQNHQHRETLIQLEATGDYDFWSGPSTFRSTDVLVKPDQLQELIELAKLNEIEYSTKIANVGSLIAQQARDQARTRNRSAAKSSLSWDRYYDYGEISDWLRDTVATSNVVKLNNIGESTEKRTIHQVYISTGRNANNESKPILYIDANIHAREWISGAVATYIINELAFNTENYIELLDQFDFYIVPILNPDGLAYSHAHENNRMWRKTRSHVLTNETHQCYGVDPNRNFPYFFGGESTSTDPCSNIYRGDAALDEPETKALADDILALNATTNGIHAYFTLHSSGQLWLISWGYTANAFPADYDDLISWGRRSVEAIYGVNHKKYATGQGADMLYGVGGASDDWAKSIGIKYTTTIELRDTKRYGFLLPEGQILPTALEAWAGIQAIRSTEGEKNSGGIFTIAKFTITVQLFLMWHYIL